MTEEERKERARENARKYYLKHKKEILQKQAIYKKKKYHSMTPKEKQAFLEKRKEIVKKYRSKNKDKFREYNKQYKEKKMKHGEIPKTKKMIIEELQTEKEQLNSLVNSCQEEIRKLKSQLQQRDEVINKVKAQINHIMQYFDESTQADLILLLIILDNKGE